MKGTGWLATVVLLATLSPYAEAGWLTELRGHGPLAAHKFERLNRHLNGTLVDYTHNHGADRRIWSEALCQKRDLYVYLPPCFDPHQSYPLVIWLHGFGQDEHTFAEVVAPRIDAAIACGKLPPHIVAAPDGSVGGHECLLTPGSFFINSKAGRFEDFLMQDVWNFLFQNYPIRPERQTHFLAGVSMGGGAAYNLGIKHRDRIGGVMGIFPPLNTRWVDCHCRYMGNFDPCCWGWRTDFSHRCEVIGRFYGVVTIRMKRITDPLYGKRVVPSVDEVSRENPIEMLDLYNVQNGELAMFIGYAGKDQFNIDAQVESFLYVAGQRGLHVDVAHKPNGKHDYRTAFTIVPDLFDWLSEQLRPFAPASAASAP